MPVNFPSCTKSSQDKVDQKDTQERQQTHRVTDVGTNVIQLGSIFRAHGTPADRTHMVTLPEPSTPKANSAQGTDTA